VIWCVIGFALAENPAISDSQVLSRYRSEDQILDVLQTLNFAQCVEAEAASITVSFNFGIDEAGGVIEPLASAVSSVESDEKPILTEVMSECMIRTLEGLEFGSNDEQNQQVQWSVQIANGLTLGFPNLVLFKPELRPYLLFIPPDTSEAVMGELRVSLGLQEAENLVE